MADDTQYQGWTNYQTWAVGLWINQDEPMYRYLKLLAHSPQLGIDKDKALPRPSFACVAGGLVGYVVISPLQSPSSFVTPTYPD